MLDHKRPLKTIKGRPATLLTTDGPNPAFPWVGVVDGSSLVHQWSTTGQHYEFESFNLVQARQKTTVYLYHTSYGLATTTSETKYHNRSDARRLGSAVIEHD